jgi:hypothetical protein
MKETRHNEVAVNTGGQGGGKYHVGTRKRELYLDTLSSLY